MSVRAVVGFTGLAYVLTWVAWVPANLDSRGTWALPVPALLLVIVGGFGPLAAAVLVTARTQGRAGMRRLFAHLDPRRTPKRWFAAGLLPLPLNLTPLAWHLATGGETPTGTALGQALLLFPLQVLFVALAGGGLDEEVGWRGFLLPALLERSTPVVANALVGLVWALWHLPMWLDPGSPHAAYPVWLFVLSEMGLAVVIGWLYAASGGNLAVAIVAHAVSNSADGGRYQLIGDRAGALGAQLTLMAAHLLAAGVVIAATRGQLGTNRLQSPRPPASRRRSTPDDKS